MESNDDARHKRIEAILGPCPFERTDDRYQGWLLIGQAMWTAQARLQATMLEKGVNAPLEELPGLVVDAIAGHFDIVASFIAATVTDFESAAQAEVNLKQASEFVFQWSIKQVQSGPRSIREGVSRHDIQTRLRARTAHWVAQALAIATAKVTTAPEEAQTPRAVVVRPTTFDNPSSQARTAKAKPESKRFPNRAAWLQVQLDERGWQSTDPQRFNGPDRRTVRKVLAGEAVSQIVLEKLIQALSTKKPVRAADVPKD